MIKLGVDAKGVTLEIKHDDPLFDIFAKEDGTPRYYWRARFMHVEGQTRLVLRNMGEYKGKIRTMSGGAISKMHGGSWYFRWATKNVEGIDRLPMLFKPAPVTMYRRTGKQEFIFDLPVEIDRKHLRPAEEASTKIIATNMDNMIKVAKDIRETVKVIEPPSGQSVKGLVMSLNAEKTKRGDCMRFEVADNGQLRVLLVIGETQ